MEKFERLMSIDFESKLTYGYVNKYIKIKIKKICRQHNKKTNFHNKKIPKEKVPCAIVCLLVSHHRN